MAGELMKLQVGFCGECREPQYQSPHGPVCKNGHGGASSLTALELEAPRAAIEDGLSGSMAVDFAAKYMPAHALVIDFEVHRAAVRSVEARFNTRIKELEARLAHIVDVATGKV